MSMTAAGASQSPGNETKLFPSYTFEEFVVGPSNRFPHAASQAVADNPGTVYNPLFLYGPVGMGKTHLMQAVGQRVLSKNPQSRVLYVTAEQFMMEVVDSLQAGQLSHLRERYRMLDLLLVDDIQFLASSEATQEEFFHIFNELHQAGKQIIMTSDRPPKMLTTLEDRLRSRFEWGLIADIKPTNLETRVAILRKKETHMAGIHLPDDLHFYIASRLKSNVRELEGFLRRIQAYAQINDQDITLALVKDILRELLPPQSFVDEDEGVMPQAADWSWSSKMTMPAFVATPETAPVEPGAPPPPAPASQGDTPNRLPPELRGNLSGAVRTPPSEGSFPPAPQAPSAPPYPPRDKADLTSLSLTESLAELGESLGFSVGTPSSPQVWTPPPAEPPPPTAPTPVSSPLPPGDQQTPVIRPPEPPPPPAENQKPALPPEWAEVLKEEVPVSLPPPSPEALAMSEMSLPPVSHQPLASASPTLPPLTPAETAAEPLPSVESPGGPPPGLSLVLPASPKGEESPPKEATTVVSPKAADPLPVENVAPPIESRPEESQVLPPATTPPKAPDRPASPVRDFPARTQSPAPPPTPWSPPRPPAPGASSAPPRPTGSSPLRPVGPPATPAVKPPVFMRPPPPAPAAAPAEPVVLGPNAIGVVFFFPEGRVVETSQTKRRFEEVIKKHKLKYTLHWLSEVPYSLKAHVECEPLAKECQTHATRIAIVLGPPPESPLQETIFQQRLQDHFDTQGLALQFVPWEDQNKDYRFLNLALDITLLRFQK